MKSLKKLISFSGNDVRQIIVEDISRFRLTQHKLVALLQGSKNLEHLELRGSTEEDLRIPEAKGILKKLNHIILQDIIITKPHIMVSLLQHAHESLQTLHIDGLPQIDSSNQAIFPHLPNLQYMRLEEPRRPSPFRLRMVSDFILWKTERLTDWV